MGHWVFQDPVLFRAWAYMLMRANHQETEILIRRTVVSIQIGQFWTSMRSLARDLDVSRETVRRWVATFQDAGMITTQPIDGLGTLVTVCNYGLYQGFSGDVRDTGEDTGEDTSETLTRTLMRPKQELNNNKECLKNEKKYIAPPGYPTRETFKEV